MTTGTQAILRNIDGNLALNAMQNAHNRFLFLNYELSLPSTVAGRRVQIHDATRNQAGLFLRGVRKEFPLTLSKIYNIMEPNVEDKKSFGQEHKLIGKTKGFRKLIEVWNPQERFGLSRPAAISAEIPGTIAAVENIPNPDPVERAMVKLITENFSLIDFPVWTLTASDREDYRRIKGEMLTRLRQVTGWSVPCTTQQGYYCPHQSI
jgi:hypothetical protein